MAPVLPQEPSADVHADVHGSGSHSGGSHSGGSLLSWRWLGGWILALVLMVMVHDPATVPTRVYAPAVAIIFTVGFVLDLYRRHRRT